MSDDQSAADWDYRMMDDSTRYDLILEEVLSLSADALVRTTIEFGLCEIAGEMSVRSLIYVYAAFLMRTGYAPASIDEATEVVPPRSSVH